jgi:anti-anti-sigma regulatory factor
MWPWEIKISSYDDGIIRIKLKAKLTLRKSLSFRDNIRKPLKPYKIILDLSEIISIDEAGARGVIASWHTACNSSSHISITLPKITIDPFEKLKILDSTNWTFGHPKQVILYSVSH